MSWFNTPSTGITTVPNVTYTPATTAGLTTTGNITFPSPITTGLGQDYAKILGQLQQPGVYYPNPTVPTPFKLPTREEIQPRIAMLEKQLELLKEVDALLEKHPDLERLVSTLHKLGSL